MQALIDDGQDATLNAVVRLSNICMSKTDSLARTVPIL